MKVVINADYGGFSVSKECAEYMAQLGSEQAKKELELAIQEKNWYGFGYSEDYDGYSRTDKFLIAAVEYLGSKRASGPCASLKIVEIPEGISWYIDDYDGNEHIAEQHQRWS